MVSTKKIWIRFIASIFLVVIYILFFSFWVKNQQPIKNYIILGAFLFNYLVSIILANYIISSKRYESFKSLWILWIILIPFLGQTLFVYFGVSGIRRRSLAEYRHDLKQFNQYEDFSDFEKIKLDSNNKKMPLVFEYLNQACDRPVYQNNDVKFLAKPHQSLLEIIKTLQQAEKFIHLEYYQIHPGLVWDAIFDILKTKIKQGVEVRIIVDYIGAFNKWSKKKLAAIRDAGIEIYYFNGFHYWKTFSLLNFRCHKKVLIVDNKYAIYGSANISDCYFNISKDKFPLNDYCYYLEGPIVNSLNLLFAYDWNFHCGNLLTNNTLINHPEKYFQIYRPTNNQNNMIMQFAESGPDVNEKIFVNNLNQIILQAKSKIEIATPYFFPNSSIINSLKIAADSGIKIKLIFPREPDHTKVVLSMNRFYYETLLESGIEIYEYYGFNHEKITVVDEKLVYTGTYNWDFRSLFLNYETVLLIYSKKMAAIHSQAFHERIAKSQKIDFSTIKRWKNWRQKFFIFCLKLVFPLI
ncbi:Cardiolipin synthase [[Mycoplasma] cavipharyngis]|uniref:phospholipase D-like domain-containing protein n=1 Tax=[Mycoplasma] cavipharyngis TaxID=92757 RepID=UPI003704330E